MPEQPKSTPPSLYPYSEATRRALYDATVAVHFPPLDSEQDADAFVPPYSPDDAGLTILYVGNHWLALWEQIENRDNPDLTPDFRYALLCIQADPSAPSGLLFSEV